MTNSVPRVKLGYFLAACILSITGWSLVIVMMLDKKDFPSQAPIDNDKIYWVGYQEGAKEVQRDHDKYQYNKGYSACMESHRPK